MYQPTKAHERLLAGVLSITLLFTACKKNLDDVNTTPTSASTPSTELTTTPNINTVSTDWKQYRTSVDAIEAATGYDILSNVNSSVQSVIEAQVDNQ